ERIEESLINIPLNQEEKKKVLALLLVEKNIFASSISDLGQMNLVIYEIDAGIATSIKQALYRAAPSVRAFIKMEIAQLKAKRLVRNLKSLWASRHGEHSYQKGCIPLPCIDNNLLEIFGRTTWFSFLDLLSKYWQVKIIEKNQKKTAFAILFSTYEFVVMPFVYLDDIIIFSTTFNEHLRHIAAVFAKLSA
ncbi:2895_t:CDS:2, partial [Dentiscutata heterogama]